MRRKFVTMCCRRYPFSHPLLIRPKLSSKAASARCYGVIPCCIDGGKTWQHMTSPIPWRTSDNKSSASSVNFLTSAAARLRIFLILLCWIINSCAVDNLVQLILSTSDLYSS